jgi:hypothetical protein
MTARHDVSGGAVNGFSLEVRTMALIANPKFGEQTRGLDCCSKHWIEARCESPIEAMLVAALSRQHPHAIIFKKNLDRWFSEPHEQLKPISASWPTIITVLQAQIENFRVDIAIGTFDHLPGESCGQDDDDVLIKQPLLIIECDGHDFHEKTKEQAQRDKSRDRALTALGHRVIRFTGSEIFRNAKKCVSDIEEILGI